MKKLFILCLFFTGLAHSSYVRDGTAIRHYKSDVPFAILEKSTFVYLIRNFESWPIIHVSCFVSKDEIVKGGLNYVETLYDGAKVYDVVDTVDLFEDEQCKIKIGKAWPSEGLSELMQNRAFKSETALEYSFSGKINESQVVEWYPWRSWLQRLDASGSIFGLSYDEIVSRIKGVSRCTKIKGDGLEYSHTYDELLPSPRIEFIWVFNNGIVVSIWTTTHLSIPNRINVANGYLYFAPSMKSKINDIVNKVKGQLEFKS